MINCTATFPIGRGEIVMSFIQTGEVQYSEFDQFILRQSTKMIQNEAHRHIEEL